MKLMPELWIAHPAADGCPVSFKRWAQWTVSNWLAGIAARTGRWANQLEHRALYQEPSPWDDIPF